MQVFTSCLNLIKRSSYDCSLPLQISNSKTEYILNTLTHSIYLEALLPAFPSLLPCTHKEVVCKPSSYSRFSNSATSPSLMRVGHDSILLFLPDFCHNSVDLDGTFCTTCNPLSFQKCLHGALTNHS